MFTLPLGGGCCQVPARIAPANDTGRVGHCQKVITTPRLRDLPCLKVGPDLRGQDGGAGRQSRGRGLGAGGGRGQGTAGTA